MNRKGTNADVPIPSVERIEAMREVLHTADLRLRPAMREEIDAALLTLHQLGKRRGRPEATTRIAVSAVMDRLISQFGIKQEAAAAIVLGPRASMSEVKTLAREYRNYKARGRLAAIHVGPIHPLMEAQLPLAARSKQTRAAKSRQKRGIK
jgi:hypothetical protein